MTTDTAAPAAAETTTTTTESATTTTAAPAATGEATITAAATTDSPPATELAAGEGKGDAAQDGEGNPDAGKTVPDTYTVPDMEGYTLEGPRLDHAVKAAKAAGFTQEQFDQSARAYVELREQERQHVMEAWGAQSKAEFGAGFDAVTKDAKAGVAWVESQRPGVLKTFDDEGWGNNPHALWVFAKLGELTRGAQVDGISQPARTPDKPATLGERWYPPKQ